MHSLDRIPGEYKTVEYTANSYKNMIQVIKSEFKDQSSIIGCGAGALLALKIGIDLDIGVILVEPVFDLYQWFSHNIGAKLCNGRVIDAEYINGSETFKYSCLREAKEVNKKFYQFGGKNELHEISIFHDVKICENEVESIKKIIKLLVEFGMPSYDNVRVMR